MVGLASTEPALKPLVRVAVDTLEFEAPAFKSSSSSTKHPDRDSTPPNDMPHRGSENPEEKPESQQPAGPPPGMHPSDFPDGGAKAWLCVAGGFCCAFCSFGWVNAIGVFQEFYQTNFLSSHSPSAISWILSLETFFMFLVAPIVGKLYDNFGPRWILIGGTFLHVFGLMMTSLSTHYYQILLAQGICSPLGAGAVLYPAMSTTVSWFHKRRALALGIMTSGSSLGGVIFPILLQRLIPRIGFAWTLRVSGFIILALLSFASVTVRSRLPPSPKPWAVLDFIRPFSELPFTTVCVGNFFGFLGLFVPFNYITLSALSLGMSVNLSNYLISMLNAGSIFGRIFPGWAADKLGRFNVQIVMMTVSFIINLAIWLPARGSAPIIVFAVLYGLASGTFVSLAPAIVAQVTADMRQIGTRTGTMFAFVSVASLIGNPIAGALLTCDAGGFSHLQAFTGVAIAVGMFVFVFSKSLNRGKFLAKF